MSTLKLSDNSVAEMLFCEKRRKFILFSEFLSYVHTIILRWSPWIPF